MLLFRAVLDGDAWWFAPGGALDPGESYADAAIREVREETGIAVTGETLLGPVWRRDAPFVWQGVLERHLEEYFLVRNSSTNVDLSGFDDVESEFVREHRWWHIDDIRVSAERFAPRRFAELLAPLLAGELPSSPIDAGE